MDIAKKKKKSIKIRCPPLQRDYQYTVIRQGWLYKLSSRIKVWKKRWCVISNYCLFYYKDAAESELLGSILLPSYQIRPNKDSYQKYSFKAEHQNMKSMYLAADTMENMKLWMNDLARASIMINSVSASDLTSGDDDSGFNSNISKGDVLWESSPYHRAHYSRSSDNLLTAGTPQPLYANAPPKPRRTYDEELYRHAAKPPRPQSADFLEKGDQFYPEKSKFRGSADDLTEPGQESMKRLLEWKQRMLQSPLTRAAARSASATPTLSFHHQQVLKDIQNHNARQMAVDLPPKPIFPKPKLMESPHHPCNYPQPDYVNLTSLRTNGHLEEEAAETGGFFKREDLYRASQMFYSQQKQLLRPTCSNSSSSLSSSYSRHFVWDLDKDVGLPLPTKSGRTTPGKVSDHSTFAGSPATTPTHNLVQERIRSFEPSPSKESLCSSIASSSNLKKTYEKTPMGSLKNNAITLSPLSSVLADLRKTADSGSLVVPKPPPLPKSSEEPSHTKGTCKLSDSVPFPTQAAEKEEEAYISMNSISEDEPVYVSMDEESTVKREAPLDDSLDYSSSSSETLYKAEMPTSSCTLKPYHKFLSKNTHLAVDKESNASDADDEASRDFNSQNLNNPAAKEAASSNHFSSYSIQEDSFDKYQYADDLDNYEKVQNLFPFESGAYPHYYNPTTEDSHPDIIPVSRQIVRTFNAAPYYYSDIYEAEPSRSLFLSGASRSEDCLLTTRADTSFQKAKKRSATPDFDLVTQREAEPCYENLPSLSQRLSRSLEGLASEEPLYENVFPDPTLRASEPFLDKGSSSQDPSTLLSESSSVSAGDLLNKSQEELVLLLISLRRRQASLLRDMEAEQEGSGHWLELDAQYRAGEPLVSLVDSMVKLGTLYDGTTSPLMPPDTAKLPPWVEPDPSQSQDSIASNYNEKLQEIARLDQTIQEESKIFSSFKKEMAVVERLLETVVGVGQRRQLQREAAELEAGLAACRRRVTRLAEEDLGLGQELALLRQRLRNSGPAKDADSKIEDMLQELAQRKASLAQAHQEVRASPTGIAGAWPLPPGKRRPLTYLETDLDSMETLDLGSSDSALYENAQPQQSQHSEEALSYMQDISEADEKVKRFYGILPREKPAEVKTVRIVKRESKRRKEDNVWQEPEAGSAKDSFEVVVKQQQQRTRRRRYNTVVGIPELPALPPSQARARDDTDLELCLKTVNTPDIVRSTIKKSSYIFDDKLIDQVLGLPQKISIPERYVEEEAEPISAMEKLKRTLKAENIKKMLTSTTVKDREQGRKMLALNHTLAREVVERSKLVAAHSPAPQLPKC